MALNKEELIDRLYQKMATSKTRYPKWELQSIVDPFIEVLNEALSEGNEVRLRNLGKFVFKVKKGRKFYNMQTRTMGATSDMRYVTFVPSRLLNFEKQVSKPNS